MNEKFYISCLTINGGDYIYKFEEPWWESEYDWKK